jgi:hypothetical protein
MSDDQEAPADKQALVEEMSREESPPPAVEAPAYKNLAREVSREMHVPPTTSDFAAVRRYYAEQARELTRQVAEIEEFLGFTEHHDQLAARIARIEQHLGIKV